jgi:gliding motility-associated lipoprotein GldH
MMTRISIAILSIFLLISCDENTILKDNYDIPDAKWLIKDTPTFTFEVKDINVSYNVFYNVRNNRNYLYHNLYLTHYLTDSNGKIVHQHLDEIILFDPITGKPSGEGLGDIYDHKVLAFKDFHFPKKGIYKIKMSQYMRQNPLLDVVSVGFSVEKTGK